MTRAADRRRRAPRGGRRRRRFDVVDPATGEPSPRSPRPGRPTSTPRSRSAHAAFDDGGARGPHQRHRAGPGARTGSPSCSASAPRTSPPLEAARRRPPDRRRPLGGRGRGRAPSSTTPAPPTSTSAQVVPVQDPGLDVVLREPVGVVRAHRAVELPAADRVVEGRARAGLRQPDRPQAGVAHPAHRARCSATSSSRPACRPRRVSRAARARRAWSATRSWPTRGSPRSASPARPPPAPRSCGRRPDNITRVSLELGGKSACVVFADADLERGRRRTPRWRCSATPARTAAPAAASSCERPVYDDFVAAFAERHRARSSSASRSTRPPRWAR